MVRCLERFANFAELVIIAPPKPVVTILLPLKLNIPTSPKVPTCFPAYLLPSASAASSTTLILYFLQIDSISFTLAGCPNT